MQASHRGSWNSRAFNPWRAGGSAPNACPARYREIAQGRVAAHFVAKGVAPEIALRHAIGFSGHLIRALDDGLGHAGRRRLGELPDKTGNAQLEEKDRRVEPLLGYEAARELAEHQRRDRGLEAVERGQRPAGGRYQITPTVDDILQALKNLGHAASTLIGAGDNRADVMCVLRAEGAGLDMEKELPTHSEPAWLDPRNDRKTPYTDSELDRLPDDQIAMMADTAAWRDLGAEVGKQRAK